VPALSRAWADLALAVALKPVRRCVESGSKNLHESPHR
jgi:hypothetical protein